MSGTPDAPVREPLADKTNKGLILFVHGLGGDASTTWGAFPSLIQKDPELRNYKLHYFSYPTSLFSWPWSKKYPPIQTLADALRTEVENRFATYSNIILVCHSLGGLIGRKYVLEELKKRQQLRIRGVLLYAVPNNGAGLAKIAKEVSWRHNQLRQLCKDADIIRELNTDWVTFKVNEAVRITYVVAALDQVVDEQSARSFWGSNTETVKDRGHRDLVKPIDGEDTTFLILKRFVLSLELPADDPRRDLEKYAVMQVRVAPRVHSGLRYRVIGFDLDGTLLRGYTYSWTLVWEYLKVPPEVSKAAMSKYLKGPRTFKDYQAWCEHDLRHMKDRGLRRLDFKTITRTVSPTNNLREALRTLKNEGFVLAIISGGIDTFIDEKIPDAKELFDYICINRLHYDDQGVVSGIEATPFDFAGKAVALETICKEHGATLAQAVFVGEGNNDEIVANRAGLSIAYPPHGQVIPAVSTEIAEDNLLKLLEHVL